MAFGVVHGVVFADLEIGRQLLRYTPAIRPFLTILGQAAILTLAAMFFIPERYVAFVRPLGIGTANYTYWAKWGPCLTEACADRAVILNPLFLLLVLFVIIKLLQWVFSWGWRSSAM
jgi:hypothetical protein